MLISKEKVTWNSAYIGSNAGFSDYLQHSIGDLLEPVFSFAKW
jgi:hypothetical protein